jgi:hypothetical protein
MGRRKSAVTMQEKVVSWASDGGICTQKKCVLNDSSDCSGHVVAFENGDHMP